MAQKRKYGFGLFVGFVDNKKHLEYHQTYSLAVYSLAAITGVTVSCFKKSPVSVL